MRQYGLITICQRTTNIINCVQEGVSLITKKRALKKKMCICFNTKRYLRYKTILGHKVAFDM